MSGLYIVFAVEQIHQVFAIKKVTAQPIQGYLRHNKIKTVSLSQATLQQFLFY